MATEGNVNDASTTNVRMDGEVARHAVEILGWRMNVADSKFKTLEDFTLEETQSIFKKMERRQWAEFEMKEFMTSMECRIMEALSKIETMKAKIKALKEGAEVGGSSLFNRDRDAKVEAFKPPMFKGVQDMQEVHNFLWHLENDINYNQVKYDKNKINTTVLYLSEMVMLWWRRKESAIEKGSCTINT
ncbi:hypothetical protein EJD97_016052 [Solanum chilense]|uniref:Retrotransposon gag domain-containing protein n=1 Tax=Solanum chilense TaxID=4083 RepID=A0A6N2BDI5_SOLCI|nr:hypothetical protein EJD97_016052 [Solanum chilense]